MSDLQKLFDVQMAVKMIKREIEKFPNESIEQLVKEYNSCWFDNTLSNEQLNELKKAIIK